MHHNSENEEVSIHRFVAYQLPDTLQHDEVKYMKTNTRIKIAKFLWFHEGKTYYRYLWADSRGREHHSIGKLEKKSQY